MRRGDKISAPAALDVNVNHEGPVWLRLVMWL